MPFYLTGGGEQEHFRQLDRHFLKSLKPDSRVAILPHACDDYQDAFERIEQEFQHKHIKEFKNVLEPTDNLLEFDSLIIEGGNTFELIRSIRDSHFFNLIKTFAKSERSIYADSAGAIILGADVGTAFLGDDADTDELKLQDYRGCDLLDGWSVHAHATDNERDLLQDLLYQNGSPILSLAEDAGVYFDGKNFHNLSNGLAELIDFSGFQILK